MEERVERQLGSPNAMIESVLHATGKRDAHAVVDSLHMVMLAAERNLVGTVQVLEFEPSRPVTEVDLPDHRVGIAVDVRVGGLLNVHWVGGDVL